MTVIDEAPVSGFHRRLLFACSGGPFLDGYLLTIVGVALIGMAPALHLTSTETGVTGVAALVGIFFGALVFGPVTDRIGREKMYRIDLVVLVVASVLSALVTSAWQVVVLRLLIGLAVGADYPIATSLLTEFTPRRNRGRMIGVTGFAWALGACVAYVVGYVTVQAFGPEQWRWLLASGGVLGLVVLLSRQGIPESPRWLAGKGRLDEANAVVEQVYGRRIDLAELRETSGGAGPGRFAALREIFRSGHLRRLAMCGVLYLCQITPQYGLYIFGPALLAAFGFGHGDSESLGAAFISVVFMLGTIPALWLVETIGRRTVAVGAFAIMTVPLVLLWLFPSGPIWFVLIALCVYAVCSGGPGILEWIYPNELFPTPIRATAVGLATSFSRFGAATGTYLLPIGLDHLGVGPVMLIGAVLTAVGFAACLAWAPETRNRALAAVSGVPVVRDQGA